MLTFASVTCIRGGRTLFADLSFALESGNAVLVTGPNGAGKSSLSRGAAGVLRVAGGEVSCTRPRALLTEQAALDPELPLIRALAFWARLDGGGRHAVDDALAALALDPLVDVPVRLLSTGQRRRAARRRGRGTRRQPYADRVAERAHHRVRRMMLVALIARDLRRVWIGGGAMLPVAFFLLVAILFPFAVGPDGVLLARVGGGVLWAAALLAALLPIARLVAPDRDVGVIDQLLVRGESTATIAFAKLIAHWLAFAPPPTARRRHHARATRCRAP